ncbi:MAG: autotransporter outer membrane beta-barrel domain-containing protein [Afipia felis]|nr:autotransporter outer membrane beta-barrel domain-containing protein [Afipia felis]
MARPTGANANGSCQSLFLTTAIVTLVTATTDIRLACAQSVTGSGDLSPGSGTIVSPNWSVDGDLYVGDGGSGTLKILAGGQVSNATGAVGTGGIGDVLVSGRSSSWLNSARLSVGLFSAGTLRVEDGAMVSSSDGIVGAGAQGDAVLTGAGTRWTNTGQFTVGSFGAGTLRIEDGATVTSNQGYIGANDTGTVTVTGAGSKWLMSPYSLTIGNFGTGSLTVENGALVRAEGGVLLGVSAGASGTLLLQGPANNRAVLETGRIFGGDGAASVTFDGGILRATDDNPNFFAGFETRTITIGANGAVIDTNGYEIEIAPSFTGAGALIKDGAGKLTLTGDSGATFAGAASVVAGTLTVNGTLGGTMEVIGGRLQGIGTVGSTINQPGGTIAPGDSIGTLTINGNYLGNGGRLEIATVLGDDSSQTSRLVVNGTTSGNTQVSIINRGGLGAQTVEGIKIIDVTGASNGSFILNGNYTFQGAPAVIAGAYAYRLYQGGVSTPTDGDWYLRSALTDPGTPSGPDGTPLYQPGVPVYEVYAANLQALNTLPTLQQRVGNRIWASGASDGNGIWGRTESTRGHFNGDVSTTGLVQSIDTWKMQVGADRVLVDTDASGRLVAGVNASYGQANSKINSIFGDGSVMTNGYGLGATLTWYGLTGFYVDGQAQVSRYNSNLHSALRGTLTHDNVGYGEAFSVEAGKRISVGATLSITPQFQLVYSNARFDRFVDTAGAAVSADNTDSLKTRWGIALDHQSAWENGRTHIYGIANISYEWLDGMRTLVSGTPINYADQRLWGGLGLGASINWRENFTVYGELSGNTPFHGFGNSYIIKGNVGLRALF